MWVVVWVWERQTVLGLTSGLASQEPQPQRPLLSKLKACAQVRTPCVLGSGFGAHRTKSDCTMPCAAHARRAHHHGVLGSGLSGLCGQLAVVNFFFWSAL